MPKPKYHIVVRTNTRPLGHPKGSCGEKKSQDLLAKFYEEAEKRKLFENTVISGSTCVGICSAGPIVIVYSDNVWYQGVTPDGVAEIIEEHILKGKPVERFIVPEGAWG